MNQIVRNALGWLWFVSDPRYCPRQDGVLWASNICDVCIICIANFYPFLPNVSLPLSHDIPGPRPELLSLPHVRSQSCVYLAHFSFLVSFPDQLGWRHLMNYADELLITVHRHQGLGSQGWASGLGAEQKYWETYLGKLALNLWRSNSSLFRDFSSLV